MAHDHEHVHDQNYYLDQICTVAVSGLLGGMGLLASYNDIFGKFVILSGQFTLWVMIGSVALLAMAVIRGATLWIQVGKSKAGSVAHSHEHHDHDHKHDHDHMHEHGPSDHKHEHGPGCDHEHAEHDHAHGPADDHSHDFAPWRYAVLLLPLMLSALLLYYHFAGLNLSFSNKRLIGNGQMGDEGTVSVTGLGATKTDKEKAIRPKLPEMLEAASSEIGRKDMDGKTAILRGLYLPLNDKQCTLFRMKITCCASDMVPSGVRIVAPDNLPENITPGEKLEVTGVVRFLQPEGKAEYIPVLMLASVADLKVRKDLAFAHFVDH
jgi:hypothetical protein